jgi:hypothetical protein
VERLREYPGTEYRNAAARFDEIEFFVEVNGVEDAQPGVEVEQIHAALEQDVLAIVDGFNGTAR